MKVIVLHPPMYPINHRFYNLLAQNIELIVYQFGEYPAQHKNWTNDKIRQDKVYYKLKIYGKGPISFSNTINPTFLYQIYKDKPDIVLSISFGFPTIYAAIFKKVLKYNLIVLSNANIDSEKNNSLLRTKIRKLISKNVDAFIAASPSTFSYLKMLTPRNNIYMSIQTIDVLQWTQELASLPDISVLRKELGLPTNKYIILGVGQFAKRKNWETIFPMLNEAKDCVFVLVGEGENKKMYEQLCVEHEVKDKVFIVDRKEGLELKKYFKVADLFAFPTLKDQFGFVVIEALSSSLPVLCSKYAGAECLIQDGYNGYIIDPEKNYSDRLKSTLRDIKNFQENATKSANEKTLEKRVTEFIDIFNQYLD